MSTVATQDLAAGLRTRERSAWQALYLAYGPRLRAFALRLTRDPHEADDLVQETFVRALPRLDQLDIDGAHLRAYLFTTLRNVFLKGCEHGRRVTPVDAPPEPDGPAAIEDDPERSALLGRQIEEVRLANAALAPRQRLALTLRDVEGASYAEIGALLELDENAVAQLISRARQSLRNALRLAQVDSAGLPAGCRRLLPQLSRQLDGQLREEQRERLLAHVATCRNCLDAMESMREASHRYRVLVPPLVLSAEAHAAAIEAQLTAVGYWAQSTMGPRRGARRAAIALAVALLLAGGAGLVAAGTGADRPQRAAAEPDRQRAASAGPGRARTTAVSPAPAPASTPRAAAGGDKPRPRGAPASTASAQQPRRSDSSAADGAAGEPGRREAPRQSPPAAQPSPDVPSAPTDSSTAGASGTPADPSAPGDSAPPANPEPAPPLSDTTAPVTEITSAATRGGRATFRFTASERATFACALDGRAFEPCTSPSSYADLAAGPHRFSVRATDAAGNTGAPATDAWTVAGPLPDLVITTLGDASFTVANVGAASADAFVVQTSFGTSVTFAGLASGAEASRTLTCRSGTLTVTADPGGAVTESDETNNRRSIRALC